MPLPHLHDILSESGWRRWNTGRVHLGVPNQREVTGRVQHHATGVTKRIVDYTDLASGGIEEAETRLANKQPYTAQAVGDDSLDSEVVLYLPVLQEGNGNGRLAVRHPHQETPADSADKDIPPAIGTYGGDVEVDPPANAWLARPRLATIRIVPGRSELSGEIVVDADALACAHPEVMAAVFADTIDIIVGQAGGVIQPVAKDLELIPVVAAEPVISAEPHKPIMILVDTTYRVIGQALVDAQVGQRRIVRRQQPEGKANPVNCNEEYLSHKAASSNGHDTLKSPSHCFPRKEWLLRGDLCKWQQM